MEENKYPWWVSSTGIGLSQRIISSVALVIPILSAFGINLALPDVQNLIDAAFIVGFGVWHVWAWLRARQYKKLGFGKYAK